MKSTKRAALYARVSTKRHGQDPETQLVSLRDYAAHRGLEIIGEYVDVGISGAKDRRPELDRLMSDARRRAFDAVLVAGSTGSLDPPSTSCSLWRSFFCKETVERARHHFYPLMR